MTWKLWTALGAFGGCGLLVLAAVIKGATTKSPFRPRKTDHDKERALLRKTLRRIHP